MSDVRVSVIIPTYNAADYLDAAVQSVLAQTYANFELIVVDDGSQDETSALMARYADARIQFVQHPVNRGAGAARDTGATVSTGEIIVFLDQDDYFHPDKLAVHVAYLAAHPEVGASYNARFELNHSASTVREIWRVPHPVTLADLVLGFPISPSELVLRRPWAVNPAYWNDFKLFHGGEIVRYGRYALAGCRFGGVNRALTYHRYHAGRVMRGLERNCRDYLFAQDTILDDERCPAEARALRTQAHTNSFMVWSFYALAQGETALAQDFIRQAVALTPTIVQGTPCPLMTYWTGNATDDASIDHAELLHRMVEQVPPELAALKTQVDWAVARGYLVRGLRTILWQSVEAGQEDVAKAVALGASIDEAYVAYLTHQLLCYETEAGDDATDAVVARLTPFLVAAGSRRVVNQLKARYAINRAFRAYRAQEYAKVPSDVMKAVSSDPQTAANRGVVSMLVRSLAKSNGATRSS